MKRNEVPGRLRVIIQLLVVLGAVAGCSLTPKVVVRGAEPRGEHTPNLNQIERVGCVPLDSYKQIPPGSNLLNVPSCSLWPRSEEVFSSEQGSNISNFIVEFNDSGLVNLDQKVKAIEGIRRIIERHKRGIVVVFAHGWHHGPQVCDDNLACFRRVLVELEKRVKVVDREEAVDPASPTPVIGVYLGWRGEESTTFPVKQLSLFHRKRIAQRIGERDGLSTMGELHDLYVSLRRDFEKGTDKRRVRMVSIGHSLGGALLFRALRERMMTGERKGRKVTDEKGKLDGFGDTVILVNPAVEAWEYRPFHRFHRLWKEQGGSADDPKAPPTLVVVGSSADQAMGFFFPLARLAQHLWRPFRALRGITNLYGMGRYPGHVTHKLSWDGGDPGKLNRIPKGSVGPCGCSREVEEIAGQFSGRIEVECTKSWWDPGDPFVVFKAGRRVISGHNDFFNPRFVKFLATYLFDSLSSEDEIEKISMKCEK